METQKMNMEEHQACFMPSFEPQALDF